LLLVIGGLDGVATLAGLVGGSSSTFGALSILGLLGGLLLRRGSARAATVTRICCAFFLGSWIGLSLVYLLTRPFGMLVAMLKFRTAPTLLWLAVFVGLMMSAVWLLKTLSGRGAAPRGRYLLLPAAVGLVLAGLAGQGEARLHRSQFVERSLEEARAQVGDGYSMHLNALEVKGARMGIAGTSTVTVWNDDEIKDIEVRWDY
jgi:hypothetical protein